MRKLFALGPSNEPYRDKLREILVDDLYRRALVPLLLFVPILYVLYRVLAEAIPARPLIGWIFVAMIVILIPRMATVLLSDRLKARVPDPRMREAVFAVAAALLGLCMAAINIVAAPIVTSEQLALMAIVAAGINSIAIISMSPSLSSYLFYMVPNIASMAVAVLIGPKLEYGGLLLFLICTNLFSLVFMATYVHVAMCRAILLRLRIDDANIALKDINARLETEVAERAAAEAALKQRNVELESANRKLALAHTQMLQSEKLASVGQLAAGIAHEINNPLAFVHSNVNSLDTYTKDMLSIIDAYEDLAHATTDRELAERRVKQLKHASNMDFLREDIPSLIRESADGLARVEKIVRDLKEFTHLDQAEWQLVDVHDELERTLNIAAHEIRPRADVVRAYGQLPKIECLPAQLNQVFLNLIVNAAQFMEKRGTITLRTGCDADSVWIEVTDDGKGIDKKHLGRVFDPFFTTKPVGDGMGLGLAVSYNIVQQHGGSIEVQSEPGRGATFTVRLPIGRSVH
ncbi:MAG TPA: ATP-binding protein [Rudaea sp.]|nr:ATP-binding protein [Rudaea sp.]